MKIKRIALLTLAAIICFSMFMVSASTKGYVTDGLVGFFDGSNNQETNMKAKYNLEGSERNWQ